MRRRSSRMLAAREVSPRAIQERGRRTWRCVCVLDDSNELRHLVLDEHVQRDVDREAGEREDRGEEGHECCEEHERDMRGEREEEGYEGNASSCRRVLAKAREC